MTRTAAMGTSSSQRTWLIEFMVSRMIPDATPSRAPEASCHAARGAPGPISATRTCAPRRAMMSQTVITAPFGLRSHYAKSKPDSTLGTVSGTTARRRVLKVPVDGVAEHRADLLAAEEPLRSEERRVGKE